jgi:hypothetical protein
MKWQAEHYGNPDDDFLTLARTGHEPYAVWTNKNRPPAEIWRRVMKVLQHQDPAAYYAAQLYRMLL